MIGRKAVAVRADSRSISWSCRSLSPALFASLLVVFSFAVAAATKDQPKTEPYDDGKPHFVYSVDAEGRKNGDYRELAPDGHVLVASAYLKDQLNGPYRTYFPNGKSKIIAAYAGGKLSGKYREYSESGGLAVSATYKKGELDGIRQETLPDNTARTENWKLGKLHGWRRDVAKDRIVTEQFWHEGRLIIPKGPALINQELAAIDKAEITFIGEFPHVPAKLDAMLHSTSLEDENRAGLRTLMAYRFLCDVPYKDMQIDRDYMAHAQAAAEITERIGKLNHTPDNPGMPEDEYRFAYKGTSSSNLDFVSNGVTASASVDSYMDDSNESNIDRVGHRRWCLNPTMLKTGFGVSGNYSAMRSFDQSRSDVSDYEAIVFPPRGLTPTTYFKSNYAWSLSLNPNKYASPDSTMKVTVTPMRFDPRKMALDPASDPLEIEHFRIAEAGIGNSKMPCVIFRPKNVNVAAGLVYKVAIEGLKDTTGETASLDYYVGFFDLVKK